MVWLWGKIYEENKKSRELKGLLRVSLGSILLYYK
jgi:hypothetical protein